MRAPLQWGGSETLRRFYLRQLQLTSTGFQFAGVFRECGGVLLFYIPVVENIDEY